MSRANPAASARQRLLNLARATDQDFQYLLLRYAAERFLVRLSTSDPAPRFVLKGALLFAVWSDRPHRPTADLDLLGRGDPDPDELADVVRDLLRPPATEDGVDFDAASVRTAAIRGALEYGGTRITARASLDGARIPLQIDVGFGDAVTPPAAAADFPTLLGTAPPRILVYPMETVVAEKFDAMVKLGTANTRMKDFFDVSYLAERFAFDGPGLAAAVRATFARRGTVAPVAVPPALTPAFAADPVKLREWATFMKRVGSRGRSEDFGTVIKRITEFLLPPLAAVRGDAVPGTWPPGGPWADTSEPAPTQRVPST